MDILRKIKKILVLVMVTSLFMASAIGFFSEKSYAASSNTNYYNVMIVLDGSGSLVSSKIGTDKEGYRYEAVDLFLGLLTDAGNHVGAIVFDDDLIVNTDIENITGSEAKKKLFNKINNQVDSNGGTNIGLALEEAVKKLSAAQDKNGLPSVILLLTDGKTDLDNDPTTDGTEDKKALEKENEVIQEANKKNIKTYAVLLNGNDKGTTQEVKKIVNGNENQYKVVDKALDLQETFKMFYSLIYGSLDFDQEGQFDENGIAETTIDVPQIGVEEVNIVVNTASKIKKVEITNPKNVQMDEEEVADITTKSRGFNLIKITKPQAGKWKIKVVGTPKDSIKFNFVYNDNLNLKLTDLTKKDLYFSQNTVKIKAALYDGKKTVDNKFLDISNLKIMLNEKTVDFKANIVEDGYEIEFNLPEVTTGTDVVVKVLDSMPIGDGKEAITVSSELNLVVNPEGSNHPPVPVENPKVIDARDLSNESYLLDEWFQDEDSDFLTYELIKSDYSSEELAVNEDELTLNVSNMLSGSASIKATDENGASCILEVQFEGNHAPEVNEDSKEIVIEKQFFKSKTEEIDLSKWFSDADKDELTLSIENMGDYDAKDVVLEGTKLVVSRKTIKKGSIVVRATDTKNAYVDCTVHFKIRNLAFWEGMGLAIIIGTALIVLIVILMIAKNRIFKGVITVEPTSDKSTNSNNNNLFGSYFGDMGSTVTQKDTFGPFHGTKYLKNLMVDYGNLDRKAKFTVVSAKKAKFTSPKPFYMTGGIQKKTIDLSMGLTVEIYPDEECTKGIRISVQEEMTSSVGSTGMFGSR